jgi:peptidoglycan/LPS O-acetylase OafA/YrhL
MLDVEASRPFGGADLAANVTPAEGDVANEQFPTQVGEAHLTYRPDLDGLRAIAVASVVIYHYFPKILPGGFVGVDIFFCISGFLISSLITRGLSSHKFSFVNFYLARVRRLFPSLIVVLLFCLAAGLVFLAPLEYRVLGGHASAGTFFVSNFVYLAEFGYFDADAQTKPLLHLWSLAVEEQFYLIWPLTLFLIGVKARRYTSVVIIVAAISFLINILYLWKTGPIYSAGAAYYVPFSRFWELMAGAAIASPSMISRLIGLVNRHLLSVIGLILLVASVVIINSRHSFPGFWAIPPILGSVFLLSAGPEAVVNKIILSNPLMVGVGLISYPLYLWHWPLLSFARIVDGTTPSIVVRLVGVSLSVLFAYLCFRFLERPIRFSRIRKIAPLPLVVGACAIGLVGLLVSLGVTPLTTAVVEVERGDVGHDRFHAFLAAHYVPCGPAHLLSLAPRWNDFRRCYQSHTGPREVAIVGDSHAEHVFPGFANYFHDVNSVYYSAEGLPSLDNPKYREIYANVMADPSINVVVLSVYWQPILAKLNRDLAVRSLLATVNALHGAGKAVLLMKDVPDLDVDPQSCKYLRPLGRVQCVEPVEGVRARQSETRQIIDEVALQARDTAVVDPLAVFCDAKVCHASANGAVLYRDRNHLNLIGSDLLIKQLVKMSPRAFSAFSSSH